MKNLPWIVLAVYLAGLVWICPTPWFRTTVQAVPKIIEDMKPAPPFKDGDCFILKEVQQPWESHMTGHINRVGNGKYLVTFDPNRQFIMDGKEFEKRFIKFICK